MTKEDKAEWQSLLRPKLRKWKWKSPHSVQLFVIPWTIQSKEFSRPETGVGNFSFSRGSSQPRDRTQVSEVTQNKVFHLIFLFKKSLEKFSTIISSSIFSWPFFLSSSGTPMIQMLGCLTLSQWSLKLSSFFLIPPECFLSHLLHYSLLIDSLLFLLGSC